MTFFIVVNPQIKPCLSPISDLVWEASDSGANFPKFTNSKLPLGQPENMWHSDFGCLDEECCQNLGLI